MAHLTENQQLLVSATMGAMLAAAHNHTLVVLDNEATVAVARYVVTMLPELEQFLLPVQPNLYQMGIKGRFQFFHIPVTTPSGDIPKGIVRCINAEVLAHRIGNTLCFHFLCVAVFV